MAVLIIKELKCTETQAVNSTDKCLLEIFGKHGRREYTQNMNKGDIVEINDSIPFESKAMARLWDLDLGSPLEPSTKLGSKVIKPTEVNGATASFEAEGGRYELIYDVRM